MLKFACSWLCLLLLATACASGSTASDEVVQAQPTSEPTSSTGTADPTPPGPTPLVIPTIVAAGSGSGNNDSTDDADSDPDGDTGDSGGSASPTTAPRPTSTPRPIPTAVVATPTPLPVATAPSVATALPVATAVPVATSTPVAPVATAVVPTATAVAPSSTPNAGPVQFGCSVSKTVIAVGEAITLQSFQDPTDVPISFAFDHGDGTIDQNTTSQAFYNAPGTYEVRLLWRSSGQSGSIVCGTVSVRAGTGATPTPIATPTAVQIGCTISPQTTVVVGQGLTFTAFQDPADVPISFVFDHGDGTLDATSQSNAFYGAPGQYQVRLQWSFAGESGTILCGTVTVQASFNASDYVGRSQASAEALAVSQGLIHRVIRIDGVWLIATTDSRADRVNFEMVGGIVTNASLG